MSDLETKNVAYLLASMQRALLNEVTPDLRGVAVSVGEDEIRGRLIFDTVLTDQSRERVSDVETEIVADYSGSVPVNLVAQHLPVEHPRFLEVGEYWAFLRYEEVAGD